MVTSPSASIQASSWASIPQSMLFCADRLAVVARKRSKCTSLGRSLWLGQTAAKALLRPRLRLDEQDSLGCAQTHLDDEVTDWVRGLD